MNENDLLEFLQGSRVLFEWHFKGTWCLVTNQWSQQSGGLMLQSLFYYFGLVYHNDQLWLIKSNDWSTKLNLIWAFRFVRQCLKWSKKKTSSDLFIYASTHRLSFNIIFLQFTSLCNVWVFMLICIDFIVSWIFLLNQSCDSLNIFILLYHFFLVLSFF